MDSFQITSQTGVDDVLRQVPQANRLFIAHHLDCIGCRLARFCTLEDVSRHYPLDLQTFITDLQKFVSFEGE